MLSSARLLLALIFLPLLLQTCMFSLLPCLPLQKHVAHCSVLHFSWFLVVSRLVQNECKVAAEGTLLFSSVDPNIKVTFPPGVTAETRSVKLQVCVL